MVAERTVEQRVKNEHPAGCGRRPFPKPLINHTATLRTCHKVDMGSHSGEPEAMLCHDETRSLYHIEETGTEMITYGYGIYKLYGSKGWASQS